MTFANGDKVYWRVVEIPELLVATVSWVRPSDGQVYITSDVTGREYRVDTSEIMLRRGGNPFDLNEVE